MCPGPAGTHTKGMCGVSSPFHPPELLADSTRAELAALHAAPAHGGHFVQLPALFSCQRAFTSRPARQAEPEGPARKQKPGVERRVIPPRGGITRCSTAFYPVSVTALTSGWQITRKPAHPKLTGQCQSIAVSPLTSSATFRLFSTPVVQIRHRCGKDCLPGLGDADQPFCGRALTCPEGSPTMASTNRPAGCPP